MPRKKTRSETIKEFKAVHGDKYDYSLVEYRNTATNIKIICKTHGEFATTPNHHKRGVGCTKCSIELKTTSKKEFVKKSILAFGNIYDYSGFSNLPKRGEVVKIYCKIHKKYFEQEPRNHMRGHTGCNECLSLKLSGSRKKIGKLTLPKELTDDFVKEAKGVHGDKYDYSLVKYKNTSTNVIIICPEHGPFPQLPSNHIRGNNCPECSKELKQENTFKRKCQEENVNYHRALKRRQAGHSIEKIFKGDYIRNERQINEIIVSGITYPNLEEAIRQLKPPASSTTISRWINEEGVSPEEAFQKVANPGYKEGVIYLITNILNEKQYVGLTIQTLDRRWIYHQEQANGNYITNENSLHSDIRKFGAEKFRIEDIDTGTSKKDLEKKEKYWIEKLNTFSPFGYNLTKGGESGGSNKIPTTIDGKIFPSRRKAAEYVSETRGITVVAAKRRISKGRIDIKSPSKRGQSKVKTKLYKSWSWIIHSVTNPRSKEFKPDITVDENWKVFEIFKEEVGNPTKKEMVLKRIDTNRGYFQDNCKWMTRSEAGKLSAKFLHKNS